MSKIALQPNASGTGTFTLASPNSNTNRTFTLPDADGDLLTSTSSLDAGKLTGTLPAIDGSALTGISAGIGSSQTWQDVSGSRSAGVSYQNTTGKPIMVAYMNSGVTTFEVQVSPNNSSWVAVGASDNTGGAQVSHQFIVPNGHYYRVDNAGAGVKVWSELR